MRSCMQPDYRKQPRWFNNQLVSLKKSKCEIRLNSFRITNNQYDLDRYLEAELAFQLECSTQKDLYHKSVLDELCNEKDTVKFWTNIKYFLNASCEHKPAIDNDEWCTHFTNLLNPTTDQNDAHVSNVINSAECETDVTFCDELNRDITQQEISCAIPKLKSGMKTKNAIARAECGRLELFFNYVIKPVKYFLTIQSTSDNRLPKLCYQMLYEHDLHETPATNDQNDRVIPSAAAYPNPNHIPVQAMRPDQQLRPNNLAVNTGPSSTSTPVSRITDFFNNERINVPNHASRAFPQRVSNDSLSQQPTE
ncbi:hypothetical protein LOTGIDRAFT_169050 [Lottia gigantea]|uniref:Uncharacterized protein n=1 Tax=Lottia gigantea TaxID=225164 RepID=V4B5L6_LOTGI|nr:hypothetical protein LOTGIDRAFT_169050 [Lottia gigantea]ESO83814.1 hypothetical protein LOTGIDRAFT_169050 [Lottia gigantea]